jgi:pSer/pThr/pTyr-binding forkhead associated (FHA) protein
MEYSVSFLNFEISPDGKEHFIEDFDSTNGTFIGEYKIAPKRLYQLSHLKSLTFGPTRCVYEFVSETVQDIVLPTNENSRENTPEIVMEVEASHLGSPELLDENTYEVGSIAQSLDLDEHIAKSDTNNVEESVREVEMSPHKEFPTEPVSETANPEPVPSREEEHSIGEDVQIQTASEGKILEVEAIEGSIPITLERNGRKKVQFDFPEEVETENIPPSKSNRASRKAVSTKRQPVKRGRASKRNSKVEDSAMEGTELEPSKPDIDDLLVAPSSVSAKNTALDQELFETPVPPKKVRRQRKSSDNSLDMSFASESRLSSKGRKRGSKVDMSEYQYRILFTGLPELESRKKLVAKLGGIEVEDWHQCTHVVTDKIRRTKKFLCCLAAGKYIMDVMWLEASKEQNSFAGISC